MMTEWSSKGTFMYELDAAGNYVIEEWDVAQTRQRLIIIGDGNGGATISRQQQDQNDRWCTVLDSVVFVSVDAMPSVIDALMAALEGEEKA